MFSVQVDIVKRDLFATVEMLRAEGLYADVRVGEGTFQVSLDHRVATFRTLDFRVAANWLAACACKYHPESDFAKLWRLLAKAAAAEIPYEGPSDR